MQKPSPAHRLLTLAALLAALPAAAAPDNITELTEGHEANAINRNGSVVVGKTGLTGDRATVWSGSNWANKTNLGTLKADNSGASIAWAVSHDGSVVAGESDDDSGSRGRATVWSGSNWGTKTDLGTLKADNSGDSWAEAISSDGSMVAGNADNDNGDSHATVWSGSNWSTKTDLGTLKSDNSGVRGHMLSMTMPR